MSDVYALVIDGFLLRLKSLRICVRKSIIKTILTEPPSIERLRMLELEIFNLALKRRRKAVNEDKEEVKWLTVEKSISRSVIPRLRRFMVYRQVLSSRYISIIFVR